MINVTKPFLPSLDEYNNYLEGIWNRCWLTNNGPLVNELELKLKEYLDLKHLLFLSNGTIALQIAMKTLDLKGEVITTPFSFVATTSTIVWEGLKPVLVDIDPQTLNIDPRKIENAITPETSAILATHVYGNACDIKAIQEIADKYKLKVIYDAAHGFGTKYKKRSIFEYGNISTSSFHATKLFHSIEGGAIITNDSGLTKIAANMRNFGFNGPETFDGVGINGKNSEFHAAMGLSVLKKVDDILTSRRLLSAYYDERLGHISGLRKIELNQEAEFNYAYYPIIFESEAILLKTLHELNGHKIFPRRYFYPSLSSLEYIGKYETPVANNIAPRVLCLPLYYDLKKEEIDFICRILIRTLKYS